MSDTIHATLYGSFVVALAQGSLGGLMFWLLGLRAPLFWGSVMTLLAQLLALIPVLGAPVVWIPAAIFLAVTGNMGKALILKLWGMTAVGTIDNLLYLLLVGDKVRLHTLLVFFAVVGGLSVFGAPGLV